MIDGPLPDSCVNAVMEYACLQGRVQKELIYRLGPLLIFTQ